MQDARWLLSILIVLSFNSFAMGSRGSRLIAHPHAFDSCKITPYKETPASEEKEQQQAFISLLRPIILASIDQTQQVRDKIIQCLEPQNSGSKDCATLNSDLLKTLNLQMKLYRQLSALNRVANSDSAMLSDLPTYSDSLKDLSLPKFMGGTSLQPLSAEEVKRAQENLQYAKFLPRVNQFKPVNEWTGRSLLTGNAAQDTLIFGQFSTQCIAQHYSGLVCSIYKSYLSDISGAFAHESGNMALEILAANPLLARFQTYPITANDLRTQLVLARATLNAWRREIYLQSLHFDRLLLAYPVMVEDVLKEHKEFCSMVEQHYLDGKSAKGREDVLIFSLKAGVTLAACLTTGPIVCAPLTMAFMGLDVYDSLQALNTARNRMVAVNKAPELINHQKIKDAYSESIFAVGFVGLAAVPFVNPVSKMLGHSMVGVAASAAEGAAELEERGSSSLVKFVREAQEGVKDLAKDESKKAAIKNGTPTASEALARSKNDLFKAAHEVLAAVYEAD